MALLLSAFSAINTVYRDVQREHQNHRSDLRDLIKFLMANTDGSDYENAIAKEGFDLAVSFPDDATAPEMNIIGNSLY